MNNGEVKKGIHCEFDEMMKEIIKLYSRLVQPFNITVCIKDILDHLENMSNMIHDHHKEGATIEAFENFDNTPFRIFDGHLHRLCFYFLARISKHVYRAMRHDGSEAEINVEPGIQEIEKAYFLIAYLKGFINENG